jgi:16S rRNA processing protein RimM
VSGPLGAGVTLARVLRPRGRRGEVAAEILTDFPERLPKLREAWLWDGAGAPQRVAVRACWLHKGQAIFHFGGSDSIAEAERLVGLEVQVPLAERVPLPPGRYYVSDLAGCEVVEVKEGSASVLGVVCDVEFFGGPPLLVVETPQGEMLIPFAEDLCRRVDIAARRIEVRLPEGLRELNRE